MPLRGPRGVDLLQGEAIVLFASAARGASAGTNGTPVAYQGERSRIIVLLNVTALATDVTDTFDCYLDVSPDDGITWINAVHFPQILGDGAAAKHVAVLDPSAPGTATIPVTSDAAVSTVRPALFGSQIRGRYVIVDPGAGVASFTFALTAYAMGGPWG